MWSGEPASPRLVRLTHLRPSMAEGLQGSPTGCPSALMAPRSGWCPRWGRGGWEGVLATMSSGASPKPANELSHREERHEGGENRS